MTREQCCQLLGVGKNATKDEIKEAFRRKAKEYHPDNNNGMDDMYIKLVEARDFLLAHPQTDPIEEDTHVYDNRSKRWKPSEKELKRREEEKAKETEKRKLQFMIKHLIMDLKACELTGLKVRSLDGREIGTIIAEKEDESLINPYFRHMLVLIEFKDGTRSKWNSLFSVIQKYEICFLNKHNREISRQICKYHLEYLKFI